MITSTIFETLCRWIDRKSNSEVFPFHLALFLALCSISLAKPDYYAFDPTSLDWKTVLLKSGDLTNSLQNIPPQISAAKKVFRLTVPAIIRVTHLSPYGVTILQYFLGFLLLVYSYKLSLKILHDKISATFVVAGITFLYFGRTGFYDLQFTWFDVFAYFSIIMALYCSNTLAIYLFSFVAAWTDERAFLALGIVLFFNQLKGIPANKYQSWEIIRPKKKSIAVLLAIISYLVLRLYLTHSFNMHTPRAGANMAVLRETLPDMTIGIWTFLEGFWLLFLVGTVYLIKEKKYVFLGILASIFTLFVVVSGCVTDITRSGSYLTPVIFVLLLYLKNSVEIDKIRYLLFNCFVISFLFPAFIVCSDWAGIGSHQHSIFVWGLMQLLDIIAPF
ncbi:hypothetical protein [Telluribacter sp.]|jgi:hypothetical protein|uniref:hypothetical protein n=1 Tax=Telluribacter sp. TaxID=1978767 RepID=UPI002E139F01|nr:hypothetical protein [Telluribacter sp.]